MYWCKEF